MVLISCPCNNDSAEFHHFFAGSYEDSTPRKPYCPTTFLLHTQAPHLHTLASLILCPLAQNIAKGVLGSCQYLQCFPCCWFINSELLCKVSQAMPVSPTIRHPALQVSPPLALPVHLHSTLNKTRQWCGCPGRAGQILNNAKKQATGAKTTSRSWINKDDLYGLHHLLRLSGS